MADNGNTEQARRMRIAESGEYISKKAFAEASKKAGDAYDRFAKMIAEEEKDELDILGDEIFAECERLEAERIAKMAEEEQALIDMMTMGE